MLLLFEIKKQITNRAVSVLALLMLVIVAIGAVRSAAKPEHVVIDAEKAQAAYTEFVLDTERKATTALRSADGEYAVSYYSAVIESYRIAMEEIKFESGDVSGWDELLRFDMPFFASLFMSILLGAAAFYEDIRVGMSKLILAARNGRRILAVNRLFSAAMLSALFCVAAAGISFACFAAGGALRNGGFVLQSAPSFFSSAEKLSLLQTFLFLSLRRCLICIAVTLGACLISKLLSGYIPIILASAFFPVFEFAVFSIRYSAVDVFLKNCNMFAYGTGYLFKRFYGVRFFGMARPENISVIAAAVLCAVFLILAVILPERRKAGSEKKRRAPVMLKLPRIKARPHKLFTWEFIKLLRTPAIFLPVCLCLILGITWIIGKCPVKGNEGEAIYRKYCEEYSGRSVFEVRSMMDEEEARISAGINRMNQVSDLYDAGEMPFEEYRAFFEEYIDCVVSEGLFPLMKTRLEYLTSASLEAGCSMEFIYDTGYNKLIGTETGLLPMLCVILLACSPFLKERESGFIKILRATENGRSRLFLKRLLYILVCTASVMLLFSAAELYAFSGDGIFESLKAPAASLECLQGLGTLPLGSYLAQVYAMRFLAAVCAALITYALSVRFESLFLVLAPVLGWMLISFALRRLGVSFLPVDLSAFVSGNAALISAGEAAWLAMLPLAALTVFAVLYSHRSFSRT